MSKRETTIAPQPTELTENDLDQVSAGAGFSLTEDSISIVSRGERYSQVTPVRISQVTPIKAQAMIFNL